MTEFNSCHLARKRKLAGLIYASGETRCTYGGPRIPQILLFFTTVPPSGSNIARIAWKRPPVNSKGWTTWRWTACWHQQRRDLMTADTYTQTGTALAYLAQLSSEWIIAARSGAPSIHHRQPTLMSFIVTDSNSSSSSSSSKQDAHSR